jgi:hypothetical protein
MDITKFIIIVAIFSLSSCMTKEFVCPEFDLCLLGTEDISFRLNDTIGYSSTTNDTSTFFVLSNNVGLGRCYLPVHIEWVSKFHI